MTHDQLPALKAQLAVERQRLRQVGDELEDLRQRLVARAPTRIELVAAAAFLHNLYNALENCLVRIAQAVDEFVPSGTGWHRLLVDQMSAEIDGLRPAVLDHELARQLDEYRRFRHAFRHMYYFDLEWERVLPLVERAPRVRQAFDEAVEALLSTLIG